MFMRPLRPTQKILLSCVALAILVTLVVMFWQQTELLAGILLMLSFLVLLLSHDRRRDAVPFVIGAVLGPAMEAVVIRSGAWQYTSPTALGIPLWLPFLWGLTAMFIMKISRWYAAWTA